MMGIGGSGVVHTDLIDLELDAQRRQRFRRRLQRIVIPVVYVIVMLGAILAIATVSYHRNRRDALALSDDLLRLLHHRIATEVKDYLTPAADMARLVAGVLQNEAFGTAFPPFTSALSMQVLKSYPQLAMVYVADTKGNFLMQKKMPDASIHTKSIEHTTAAAPQVTWIRRDPRGEVIAVEDVTDDTYDPRTRPWYRGAITDRDLHWSDVYVFFTDQKPGLTAALPMVADDGEIRGVLGLDIELEQMSAFLASLSIGRSGQAMIIDEAGRLIAYPDLARTLKQVGDELQPVRLDELGDPVLTRAFDRFRVEGPGHRILNVNGRHYISAASSLHTTTGRNWSVLSVVPEEDFVGFVTRNTRKALAMSLVIVGLASVLAALLVVQGLRADRHAQLVLERQQQLEAQSRAFSALASQAALFDPDDTDSLTKLTEVVSDTVKARRVSLWRLVNGARGLICDDCYDRESAGHTQGAQFARDDLPLLFEVLDQCGELAVRKADSDPRTAELHRLYLHPFGCDALLAVPIVSHDTAIGSVWFEDERRAADWDTETLAFARAIASMLALRLSARVNTRRDGVPAALSQQHVDPGDRATDAMPLTGVATGAVGPGFIPRPAMRTAAIADERASAFLSRLSARGLNRETMGGHVCPDTTVMFVQFTDPLMLAERADDTEATCVVDHLVRYLEDLATAHGVEYLKIMSAEIVCAAGFDGNPDDGARTLADMALDVQERCVRLFAELHTRLEFRIGMDTGVVIGSPVGRAGQSYNLWGEAVRAAEWMAETGTAGSIQVTESTYQRLRSRYLFKVRGTYYLRDVGELSTYMVTGRL
jgi:adenylate cyclase